MLFSWYCLYLTFLFYSNQQDITGLRYVIFNVECLNVPPVTSLAYMVKLILFINIHFKRMHWLPVKFRIHYKLSIIVFKCFNGFSPKYLCDLLECYRLRKRWVNALLIIVVSLYRISYQLKLKRAMFVIFKLRKSLILYKNISKKKLFTGHQSVKVQYIHKYYFL